MRRIFINTLWSEEENGGSKAKTDINVTLRNNGYEELRTQPKGITNKKIRKGVGLLNALRLFFLPKDSVVVYQSPSYLLILDKLIMAAHKMCKFNLVMFIHDIESLRKLFFLDNRKFPELETNFYKQCDYIVCHNESMKKYLMGLGIPSDRIVPIEIFDYRLDEMVQPKDNYDNDSIIIAGNLTREKSSFIYQLDDIASDNLKINLYGFGYDKKDETKSSVNYLGLYSPEEIPYVIDGKWGLVWDGNSLESCTGSTGEYLVYINQHKVSLYLASKIPVIMWSKSGLAPFITENDVGICVDSLTNIEQVLKEITPERYSEIKRNTEDISAKLMNGDYSSKALHEIEKKIETQCE